MQEKGFTLIEVLAVIILIAMLALITIPITKKEIDSAQQKIAKNNANSYKKAISQLYYHQMMNKDEITLEGTYTITLQGNIKKGEEEHIIEHEGNPPKNGFLTYENNELKSGCLTIGKYKVEFENGEINNTIKGECD